MHIIINISECNYLCPFSHMRSVLSDHPTSFTITVTSDAGDSGDSEYSKQHRGCRLAFESACLVRIPLYQCGFHEFYGKKS